MSNILDEIKTDVATIKSMLLEVQSRAFDKKPDRIPFIQFCKDRNITRPTGYAWHERGLIQLEKIGGRQYVITDSIRVTNKYKREVCES